MRDLAGESYSPEMSGGLSPAASGGKTANPPNRMAERQAWSKRIASGQGRHVMLADVPGGCGKCPNQSARKNSACLQRIQAENIAGMRGVVAPVIDDVKHLGADNSAHDHDNSQVPCVIGINALLLCVAHADPQAEQDAQR